MKKITKEGTCDFLMKRQAIEGAMAYWDKKPKEYFVYFEVSYYPPEPFPLKKTERFIGRREIVSQYLKGECVRYWNLKGGCLRLTKEEYLELWDFLELNKVEKKRGFWDKVKDFFKRA